MPDHETNGDLHNSVTPGFGNKLIDYLNQDVDPNFDPNEMETAAKNMPRKEVAPENDVIPEQTKPVEGHKND